MNNKKILIYLLVENYFKNTNKEDRKLIKIMFKKLNVNDLENLDLYLNEIIKGDRFKEVLK